MNDAVSQWARVARVLEAVLDQPIEDQARILRENCGDDPALQQEVESMLRAHAQLGDFAAQPAIEASVIQSALTAMRSRCELAGAAGLQPGVWVGEHQILELIGRGGMGEVYRAYDMELGREVAVKVLPESLLGDAQRLALFRREAQLLANLNHPNICTVYGLKETDGVRPALILELVDGYTLAERIARGPIPLEEVLGIARQIAAALEAAHEHGIVHRDLKPANVKLRSDGTVKVLDFGLAKRVEPTRSNNEAGAATLIGPLSIVGTAAYMSPEQTRGEPVDKRTDIWAFGCVLFELLTGAPTFGRDTIPGTFPAVLSDDPPWEMLPPAIPATVRWLLRRCLERDGKRRLRDIGEARVTLDDAVAGCVEGLRTPPDGDGRPRVAGLEIEEAMRAPAESPPPAAALQSRSSRLILAATVALGAALAAALVAIALRRSATPTPPAVGSVVSRFEIPTPSSDDPLSYALSSDGRQLAFVASSDNVSKIWIRALDQVTARPLAGTDGANYPFWSPRGDALGFFADGKLKRIDLAAGGPRVLADAPAGRGGAWSPDGTIAYAPTTISPCLRIPESGGVPEPFLKGSGSQLRCRWPQFLPDQRHVLFWSFALSRDATGVYLADVDGTNAQLLLLSFYSAVYDPAGYLLVVEQGALIARRFDPDRAELGPPVTVATDVGRDSSYRSGIAVSSSMLVLRSAAAVRRQLVWIDRRGMRLGTFGPPDDDGPVNPALSPDGQRVAIQRFVDGGGVWTMDRARETPIRFDSGLNALMPLWSPDGSRLWYGYVSSFLAERLTNGTAAERRLAGLPWQLTDWSADGRFVLANDFDEKAGFDVKGVRIENDNELRALPVVQRPFDQRNATFAPDSKWIVYDSNESGRFEVYAEPFPPTGGRWQISTGGGVTPRWSHSGREVFYVAPDGSMMSAPLGISSDGKAIEPGAATRLFTMAIVPASGNRHQYVVAKDDQRFLVNLRVDETLSTPITIVQNWAAELGKK